MTNSAKYTLLNYLIAIVWIVNGLFCKVFNLVPRHQAIVARILRVDYPRALTLAIGLSEIIMGIWVASGIRSKLNAVVQILIVVIMNGLEFFLASHLLLWGKLNAFFAFLFVLFIYYNEFHLNKKAP